MLINYDSWKVKLWIAQLYIGQFCLTSCLPQLSYNTPRLFACNSTYLNFLFFFADLNSQCTSNLRWIICSTFLKQKMKWQLFFIQICQVSRVTPQATELTEKFWLLLIVRKEELLWWTESQNYFWTRILVVQKGGWRKVD